MCDKCNERFDERPEISSSDSVSAKTAQSHAIEHMQQVLLELGFDLTDENFQDTPRRFVKYLQEFQTPYNAAEILKVGFGNAAQEDHIDNYHGLVAQADIPFRTACPHHLLPVMGVAHVGYIPDKRVVGLSKLARLVKSVGLEQPRMQEEINDIIANTLNRILAPKGVIVIISATHSCMSGRGIAVPNVPTITSSVRGVFRDVPAARDEFLTLISKGIRHV